jgi:hypothetical protein
MPTLSEIIHTNKMLELQNSCLKIAINVMKDKLENNGCCVCGANLENMVEVNGKKICRHCAVDTTSIMFEMIFDKGGEQVGKKETDGKSRCTDSSGTPGVY